MAILQSFRSIIKTGLLAGNNDNIVYYANFTTDSPTFWTLWVGDYFYIFQSLRSSLRYHFYVEIRIGWFAFT